VESLGLTGEEVFSVEGQAAAVAESFRGGRELTIVAQRADGPAHHFTVTVRIDTPQEIRYYQHGGILPYVLRQLLAGRVERPVPAD